VVARRLPVWPVLRQLRGEDRLGLGQAAQSSRSASLEPAVFDSGFRTAMTIAAVLCAGGGLLSWFTIRNPVPEPEPEPRPGRREHDLSCPLSAPPLRRPETSRTA
jgi:hypothetical protein